MYAKVNDIWKQKDSNSAAIFTVVKVFKTEIIGLYQNHENKNWISFGPYSGSWGHMMKAYMRCKKNIFYKNHIFIKRGDKK